jgi:hypothetical protein
MPIIGMNVLIGQRQRFLSDAGFLLTHQDAGWGV